MNRCGFFLAGAVIAGSAFSPTLAMTQPLQQPSGEVVLTVGGQISRFNGDAVAMFDQQMLATYPVTQFTTTTVWTQGEVHFAGVALAEVLRDVGASGSTIIATGVDEFFAEIPMSSITDTMPILAYAMDGQQMSLRNRGPLWIMYPYDSNATLRSEVVQTRSVWQLIKLDVAE